MVEIRSDPTTPQAFAINIDRGCQPDLCDEYLGRNAMEQPLVSQWCPARPSSQSSVLIEAFDEAKARFGKELSQDERKIKLLDSQRSLEEVCELVEQAMNQYNSSQKYSKAKVWLRKFSGRVKIYGDILDVFVQHHPEYVSLVWGAMKLLFTSFVNHEKTITKLAEGLSKIADELPTIEFLSEIYPTERMETAIAEVNAYMLRFLIRAHDWYREGSWKHIVHSITRPSELRYDDILEAIYQKTATIRNLASCGQQGVIHDMRNQLGEVNTRLEQLATATTLQSASIVSINSKLTDLQFSQIMRSIPATSMLMPEKVFDYLKAQASRRRASLSSPMLLSHRFVNSPKLRKWTESDASTMILVKGNFRSRQPLRDFCFDVIKQLREAGIHALLAIKIPVQDPQQAIVTCADILRYLIRQGLQITQSLQTESSMALTCTRIHSHLSEGQLFQILESILCEISEQVYLVIDLELLNQDFTQPQGFSWLQAFLGFFERLSTRKPTHRVKVLLLNYGSDFPFALSCEDVAKFVLRAKAGGGGAQQPQARKLGQPRSRGSFRLRARRGGFR